MKYNIIFILFFLFEFGYLIGQEKPNLVIQENHASAISRIASHPTKNIVATADQSIIKLWDSRSWKILQTISIEKEMEWDWTILNLEFDHSDYLIVTIVELLPDPRNYFVSYLLGERKSLALNILTGDISVGEDANFIVPRKGKPWLSIFQLDTLLAFKIGEEITGGLMPKESLYITFAQMSPNQDWLICAYLNGAIEFRNPNSFDLVFSLQTNLHQITDIHFSGDSLMICEGANRNDGLLVIDLIKKELQQRFTFNCEQLDRTNTNHLTFQFAPLIFDEVCHFGIDFHGESGWLAMAAQFNRIRLFNLYTKEEHYVTCPFSAIYDLSFLNNGSQLVLTGQYWENSNFAQSPILSYDLASETFSEIPFIPFDYTEAIGFTESGDAIYSLNLSSFNKWSLKNLSRMQTNLVQKRSNNYSNFLKGNHQYFIEKPPSFDELFLVHGINKRDTTFEFFPFLKIKEEVEHVVGLVPKRIVITSSFLTDDFYVYDLQSNKLAYSFKSASEKDFKISEDGRWLVYFNAEELELKVINTKTWQTAFLFSLDKEAAEIFSLQQNFAFDRSSQQFAFFQDRLNPPEEEELAPLDLHYIQVYHLDANKKEWALLTRFKYDAPINTLAFGHDGKTVLAGTEVAPITIQIWDIQSGKLRQEFIGHEKPINFIADHDGLLFSNSEDNTYRLWEKATGEELFRILNYFDGIGISEIILSKEGYYMASSRGLDLVAYQIGDKGYPFEQLDLKQNRPDKVISLLPNVDSALIKAYRKAYFKRLEKMDFTPKMFQNDFHVPQVNVNLGLNENDAQNRQFSFFVTAQDDHYLLDKINVWVNDVPVFGKQGISLRERKISQFQDEITIELSTGSNKIQVSAMNTNGGESLKETFTTNYLGKNNKPDLYILAIGVSKYQDTTANLNFPTVDMDSLIQLFQSKKADYRQIHIISLYDQEVTEARVKALKAQLERTQIDDKVIVAYAGHGLLDADFNYYLSTYAVDFSNPGQGGLPYEVLEDLLDNIPARNKLLLVDACHSGEIDRSYIQQIEQTEKENNSMKFRNNSLNAVAYKKIGIQNSFELMRLLFVDLRRSTGATVISSSGGVQMALESTKWGNSAFMHTLINALRNTQADGAIDGLQDGTVSVSELNAHLTKMVPKLTNGLQIPTSRVLNRENDWPVW